MPIAAPFPEDENNRLKALQRYGILDTDPEQEFDRVTSLASEIFGAPIVLVSFVDECRQWFKSRVGLDATETPRDIAFCAHAILDEDIFYIKDATKDERFFDSPLVLDGPKIRTYAGAPLITDDGFRLGTLCLIYPKVTDISKKEFDQLKQLSKIIVDALELKLSYKKSEEAQFIAEGANLAKSQFLAMISHEIRTPMNGVMRMLSLLQEEELSQKQKNMIGLGLKSSKSLLKIVDDLLDSSKLEARKITVEEKPFSPTTAVQNVCDLLFEEANKKGVQLKISPQKGIKETILGDPARVKQILFNLIGNAIKFTDKGQIEVQLTYTVLEKNTQKIKFNIRDTGIGIKEENLPTLFDEFTQAENSISRTYGGTGLGLSISKNLTELMGGEIGVKSVFGEGSHFWFTIVGEKAISPSLENESMVENMPTILRHDLKALVADDVEINRDVIKLILGMQNIIPDMAEDGVEAFEKFQKNDYDIVLMDIHMPKMNGLKTTKKIRSLKGAKATIPIIALTADAAEGNKELFESIKINKFITKPIDPENLIEIIAKELE